MWGVYIYGSIWLRPAHPRVSSSANRFVCAALFVSKVPREAVSKVSLVFNIFRLEMGKSHRVR